MKMCENKKYVYICSPKTTVLDRESGRKSSSRDRKGEVPEWSIGPHSKCGVRATVPGVRIPPSPPGKAPQGDNQTPNPASSTTCRIFFIPVRLLKDPKSRPQASGRLPTVRSTPTSAWFFRRSDRSTAQSAPTGPSVRLSRAFPTTSTFPRPPSRPPGRESRSPMLPVRVSR